MTDKLRERSARTDNTGACDDRRRRRQLRQHGHVLRSSRRGQRLAQTVREEGGSQAGHRAGPVPRRFVRPPGHPNARPAVW